MRDHKQVGLYLECCSSFRRGQGPVALFYSRSSVQSLESDPYLRQFLPRPVPRNRRKMQRLGEIAAATWTNFRPAICCKTNFPSAAENNSERGLPVCLALSEEGDNDDYRKPNQASNGAIYVSGNSTININRQSECD